MKVQGVMLILLGILGVIAVIVNKIIKDTIQFIGPKSLAAFTICGFLIIVGILLLLRSRKS